MSSIAPESPAELRDQLLRTIPPEPVALRAELHALAREQPGAAREAIAIALQSVLAAVWVRPDEGRRLTRRALDEAVGSASRETWLWVIGDRNWTDTACALAGRSARRSGTCQPQDPGADLA